LETGAAGTGQAGGARDPKKPEPGTTTQGGPDGDRDATTSGGAGQAGKRYRTPFEGQRLDLVRARFQVLAIGAPGRDAVKLYPLVDEIIRPVLWVGMPRAPRLNAPGGTMHLVARRGTQRAVGGPAFVAPYVPWRGRRRIGTMPSQNHEVRA
jgi:hypothetical protein